MKSNKDLRRQALRYHKTRDRNLPPKVAMAQQYRRAGLQGVRHELGKTRRWHVNKTAIIQRFARVNADDHIVRCTPGPKESFNAPSVGKVVYDSEKAALTCSAEIAKTELGAKPVKAYACGRGELDDQIHWHVTSRGYLDGEVLNDEEGTHGHPV